MPGPQPSPSTARRRTLAAVVLALALGALAAPGAQASISISDAQINEAGGSATFVVTRRAAVLAPAIQVAYGTRDSSAKAPADYAATQGTLSFDGALLGATQMRSFSVAIADDQLPEALERFKILITGREVVDGDGVGTIVDEDPAAPAGRLGSIQNIHQQRIARAGDGGAPNAAASEPAISWDARTGRYVAYSSTATNIAGATDGRRNVFLVRRGGRPGKYGAPWQYGSTSLASAGLGGTPANGDSWSPSLDGWTTGDRAHRPTCLAFVSAASNLVAGDANGQSDVFVRRLRAGALTRVASPAGRPASEVAVAGDCRTIAVVAGGALYAKRPGTRLRKLADGGVSSPDLTFNGKQISYARGGRVFARRLRGPAHRVAAGNEPTSDHGGLGGKLRTLAFQRGGHAFWASVAGRERRIGAGSMPAITAGGAQVMFAHGPFVYLYAVSNRFGKKRPQGYCPAGQGDVSDLSTSSRGNYIVFSCAGGGAYLTYLGPK